MRLSQWWAACSSLVVLALLPSSVHASPLFGPPAYHPVVLWHGLGDSAYSASMQSVAQELRDQFPGMYVRLVTLADNFAADQRAGFFGNLNEQVQQVCSDLAEDPELHDGFDAIGFSQGGQFLRAYVQRCNKPAVRNLITFGSQHMGISDLPACKPTELLCRLAEGALRNGVYSNFSQTNIVTAQYYRDPTTAHHYQQFIEANHFIADINNEVSHNEAYKTNLKSLDNLVLLMFSSDATVQPRQSSWFESYPVAKEEDGDKPSKGLEVVPLHQSSIYTDDRIGLRALDKRGGLVMDICHGRHMQIDEACMLKVFGKYAGTAPPSKLVPRVVRHAWGRCTVLVLSALHSTSVVVGLWVAGLGSLAYVVSYRIASQRRKGAIRLA